MKTVNANLMKAIRPVLEQYADRVLQATRRASTREEWEAVQHDQTLMLNILDVIVEYSIGISNSDDPPDPSTTRGYVLMRRCKKCGKNKAISEYGKHGTAPTGLKHTCKECTSEMFSEIQLQMKIKRERGREGMANENLRSKE